MSQVDEIGRLMVATLTAAHIDDHEAYDNLVSAMTAREMRLVLSGVVGVALSTARGMCEARGDEYSVDEFLRSFGADIVTGKFGARE